MMNWPPDLPLPTVEEVKRATLDAVSPGCDWPAPGARSNVDALMRRLCADILRQTRDIGGHELAEAVGWSAHASVYDKRGVATVCLAPVGAAMRGMILANLIRAKRGECRRGPDPAARIMGDMAEQSARARAEADRKRADAVYRDSIKRASMEVFRPSLVREQRGEK